MSDKIRIVGSFGEQVVSQVQSFVGGLQGVSTVSVLRDGNELYPQGEGGSDEETTAPGGEPASAQAPAEGAPAEEPVESPPWDAETQEDRRVGPADWRESDVTA